MAILHKNCFVYFADAFTFDNQDTRNLIKQSFKPIQDQSNGIAAFYDRFAVTSKNGIIIREIKGSKLKKVASFYGYFMQPVWSSKGKYLACLSR